MNISLIWGCDPASQFETKWIYSLLSGSSDIISHSWYNNNLSDDITPEYFPILVESGLKRLEKNPSFLSLSELHDSRLNRLHALSTFSHYALIHLSDEEGFDAESFYRFLQPNTSIFRNFYHPRLNKFSKNILSFPIGPRHVFIDSHLTLDSLCPSSKRHYPWSFMGTLWPNGSRKYSVSLFLRSLPDGFFYGGHQFGSGLPLLSYKKVLCNSIFALAPEGDRHLDTFRLWESLSCGCLPLVVNYHQAAVHLLPNNFPLPIFDSWKSALSFAIGHLSDKNELNKLQIDTFTWWLSYKSTIQSKFNDLTSGSIN